MISLSNLVKHQWITQNEGQKVIIDSNRIIDERMVEWAKEQAKSQEVHKIMPAGFTDFSQETDKDSAMNELLADKEEPSGEEVTEEEFLNAKEQAEVIEQIRMETQKEADAILAEARAQAQRILEDAQNQAEALYEEQKQAGYESGAAQIQDEIALGRKQLEEEYQEKSHELEEHFQQMQKQMESELVDTILQVFDRVFQIQFSEKKELLLHLIDNTLHHVESSRFFRIKVSNENRSFIEENLEQIRHAVGSDVVLEVVSDAFFDNKSCMIESDYGVFDCSIDVELDNLIRDIRSLAG